ncbi:MAG: ATP-binding protein [Pseudomonadota bacterium]
MNIRVKLFLALLAITGAVVSALVVGQWVALDRGVKRFARAQELSELQSISDYLVERYQFTGDWSFLERRGAWPPRRGRNRPPPPLGERRGPPPHDARPPPRGRWWTRIALLDSDGAWLAGRRGQTDGDRLDITLNGETIGTLVIAPLQRLEDERQIQFERRQVKFLLFGGTVALFVAAIGAALLARSFSRPVRALSNGAEAVARGEYDARVQIDRQDEIGQLATSFNQMAAALGQARTARRQWVADIAHELRTPLSVLQGEIEALEDGIRPLDNRALASLSEETRRLGALVDDLHQLALADAGALTLNVTDSDPGRVLSEVAELWTPRMARAGITLTIDASHGHTVHADNDRLRQILENLLGNTLRYTDAPGRCQLTCTVSEDQWQITLDDTAPGVPSSALPKLFNRLYRVQSARSRDTGGSGLGLAIVASLVAAHGGDVLARDSELGGLGITLRFPLRTRL